MNGTTPNSNFHNEMPHYIYTNPEGVNVIRCDRFEDNNNVFNSKFFDFYKK